MLYKINPEHPNPSNRIIEERTEKKMGKNIKETENHLRVSKQKWAMQAELREKIIKNRQIDGWMDR